MYIRIGDAYVWVDIYIYAYIDTYTERRCSDNAQYLNNSVFSMDASACKCSRDI